MTISQLHWDYTETSGTKGISETLSNLAWVLIFLTESVRNDGVLGTDTSTLTQFKVTHLHTHTPTHTHPTTSIHTPTHTLTHTYTQTQTHTHPQTRPHTHTTHTHTQPNTHPKH